MWEMVQGIWLYTPIHFILEEVFPPDLLHGKETWAIMNPYVLTTMDRLRERYGMALMNTYGLSNRTQSIFGTHYFRGWRSPYCRVGARLSQHKMGSAADMAFADVSAESIREDILAQPYDKAFEHITCIEMEVNWLHFDVRPHDKANKGILQIFP